MSSFNISLTPPQFEYVTKPGSVLLQAYDVQNNSSTPVTLTSSVESWAPKGFDGQVVYDPNYSSPHLAFSLANADLGLNAPFTLNPGEKRQLVLKIKSTTNIGQGDYYYTFFVNQQTQPLTNPSDTGAAVSGRLGSHLLLSVAPESETPNLLRLGSFFITPKIKDSFLTPLSFSAQIENPGDYFNKIDGQIKITKAGKEINTLNFDPLNVLSRYSRTVQCSQNPACTIRPPFWPGSYTATITVNGKSSTLNFYVFPFSLLLLFLFLGALSRILVKKPYKSLAPRKAPPTPVV